MQVSCLSLFADRLITVKYSRSRKIPIININDTTSDLCCQIFLRARFIRFIKNLQKTAQYDIIYTLQLNKLTVQVPDS